MKIFYNFFSHFTQNLKLPGIAYSYHTIQTINFVVRENEISIRCSAFTEWKKFFRNYGAVWQKTDLIFVGIINFKCGSRSHNAIADTIRVCYFLSMYLEGSKLMMDFFHISTNMGKYLCIHTGNPGKIPIRLITKTNPLKALCESNPVFSSCHPFHTTEAQQLTPLQAFSC